MRIRDVRCVRLTYRYTGDEAWSWPGGTFHGWTAAFVVVESDDGLVGLGEIGDGLPAPEVVPAVVERFAPTLRGEDPQAARKLIARLQQVAPTWGRRGLAISVMSGIEAALLDLLGKSLGVPVHVLLGGARWDRLPVYASGGLDPDGAVIAEELRGYVEQGFTAVKLRIGYGLDRDLEIARSARDAVGAGTRLLLDVGGSYLPAAPHAVDAARLARGLEPLDPYWLEEPLAPEDIAAHTRLRGRTTVPIAAGENTRTRHEAVALLEAGAVDVLQTDVVYVGGMNEQIAVGHLAEARGVSMAPHTWGSAPGLMANLHAAFCLSNTLIIEYSQALNPLRQRLLVEEIEVVDGHVAAPTAPGLGVELTDEVLDAYPYDPHSGVEHNVSGAG